MRKAGERIVGMVTAEKKRQIAEAARDAEISTGEYMRRAGAEYCSLEDAAMAERVLRRLTESTRRASAAADSALA